MAERFEEIHPVVKAQYAWANCPTCNRTGVTRPGEVYYCTTDCMWAHICGRRVRLERSFRKELEHFFFMEQNQGKDIVLVLGFDRKGRAAIVGFRERQNQRGDQGEENSSEAEGSSPEDGPMSIDDADGRDGRNPERIPEEPPNHPQIPPNDSPPPPPNDSPPPPQNDSPPPPQNVSPPADQNHPPPPPLNLPQPPYQYNPQPPPLNHLQHPCRYHPQPPPLNLPQPPYQYNHQPPPQYHLPHYYPQRHLVVPPLGHRPPIPEEYPRHYEYGLYSPLWYPEFRNN